MPVDDPYNDNHCNSCYVNPREDGSTLCASCNRRADAEKEHQDKRKGK